MTDRSKQLRRVKRRNNNKNKDGFIFTNNLSLIKPYVKYLICIENFISRFGPNDVIIYDKNIGFALIQYKDFCPINILDDPYCLDFIYINKNERGKGYGRILMKLNLNHFQIVIHALDDSLGFFEHISNDFGLEKINTGMPFGVSFISSNLSINREPVVIICLGDCGLKFSGYNRYVCSECHMGFMRRNIDMRLVKLNDALRSKLKKHYQPSIFTQTSGNCFLEMTYAGNEMNYKQSIISALLEELSIVG